MTFVVNFIVEDSRFDIDEITPVLDSVQDFYKQCGHKIFFVRRLGFYQPRFSYVLYFTNGHAYSYAQGRIANITYNDWANNYPNWRPHLVIHEINHQMFSCPDHYGDAVDYEPCSEPCIMHSPEEGTLCTNCLSRIQNRQPDLFPLIVTIGVITAPIWFPIIADWFAGK